jgi:hypothetical protein
MNVGLTSKAEVATTRLSIVYKLGKLIIPVLGIFHSNKKRNIIQEVGHHRNNEGDSSPSTRREIKAILNDDHKEIDDQISSEESRQKASLGLSNSRDGMIIESVQQIFEKALRKTIR